MRSEALQALKVVHKAWETSLAAPCAFSLMIGYNSLA